MKKKAQEFEIEVAFSKPFCALKPDNSKPNIASFLQEARIGKPEIEIKLQKEKDSRDSIIDTKVKRSAPCGSTWFIARKLLGLSPGQPDFNERISEALDAYPCTASKDSIESLGIAFKILQKILFVKVLKIA